MCGIVGAILQRNVSPILLEGLKRMEYRGYDSAGLAVITDDHRLERVRVQGKVNKLEEALSHHPVHGHIGIAHTRWATHGKPSIDNAHPHLSGEKDAIIVVHNGIIENFQEIKTHLEKLNYVFTSDTDTEVIAHLIYEKRKANISLLQAVRLAVNDLKGAYSIGVMAFNEPDHLIAVRNGAPLVIGLGFDENYFASDHLALLPVTQRLIYLQEGDIAELSKKQVHIFDAHDNPVEREVKTATTDLYTSADKGQYAHFMQKEIFEQPHALRMTLEGRCSPDHVLDAAFGYEADKIFDKVQALHFVACGTSYHAAQVARLLIEKYARLPCHVEIASEYRYRQAIVPENALLVVISQSGETADTLAALQLGKPHYLKTLAICNVPESAIVRESDLVLLTRAGPEIGVASTKAFTTQLAGLLLLTLSLARRHNPTFKESEFVHAFQSVPDLLQAGLKLDASIAKIAHTLKDKQHALFLGRGEYFPIAREGALKLKEISYIHAQAYPIGELKHGPLALVDEDMPVIAIAPDDALLDKLLSNLEEVRTRGGKLIVFTNANITIAGETVVHVPMGNVDAMFWPLLFAIPMQLLAYHVAVLKGTDVDQPRNLAKSVTVG
ncbi:MAG: glutamine--fructose-6-phosphate transaminase (isomerizing) [Legionellales bacterium]|jgi:glucosamine--fructose-6-phosphate aminotransferase (isomerizing)